TGRIREHIEDVFSWPCAVIGGFENFILLPIAGPALLDSSKREFFALGSGLLRCVRHDVLSTIQKRGQILSQSSILTGLLHRPPNRMFNCRVPAGNQAAPMRRIDVRAPTPAGTPKLPQLIGRTPYPNPEPSRICSTSGCGLNISTTLDFHV